MQEPPRTVTVPLGAVRECACGVLVQVDGDGRKTEYETGRVHLHVVQAGG